MSSRALVLVLAAVLLGLVGFFLFSESGPDAGSADSGAPAATQTAKEPGAPPSSELAAAQTIVGGAASSGNRVAAEAEAGAEPVELAAESSQKATPTTTLTGRVVDAQGRGLAGVQLELRSQLAGFGSLGLFDLQLPERPEGTSGTTGSDGRFSMEAPGEGAAALSLLAEGYERRIKSVTLNPGDRRELSDLTLTKGCILSGRVVDASGAPVSGAGLKFVEQAGPRIFASFGGGFSGRPDATTDDSGSFRLSHAPAGAWRIEVNHDSHPAKNFEGEAVEAGSTVSGLLFQLDRAGSISGSIVGFVPGSKLQVTASSARAADESNTGFQVLGRRVVRTCQVEADGTWILRGLEAEETFDLELHEVRPNNFRAEAISERAVQARAGDAGVTLEYQPGWALTMQVADSRTGEPIEDYRFLFGTQFSNRAEESDTDRPFADGRSSYSNLRMPSGFWFAENQTASVEAQGYATRQLEIPEVAPGGLLELGRILLDPVPTLTVKVTDAETGEPVSRARVGREVLSSDNFGAGGTRLATTSSRVAVLDGESLNSSSGSALTDSNGIAVLDGLPGARVDITVTHPAYAPSQIEDLPLADEPSEVAVELGKGGQVDVMVVDESGRPVPGIRVGHKERSPSDGLGQDIASRFEFADRRVTTNSNGLARFNRLPFGTHGFRIEEDPAPTGGTIVMFSDGPGSDWTEFLLATSEPVEIQLVLLEKSEAFGRITQVGAPLAGATVSSRNCLLYTSPSPRDRTRSRMPSSA